MRNIFGLLIVLFGVGFLLQQFDVPGAERVMSAWWPLAVIAVGLVAWNSNRKQWFGPFVITLVGAILLLDQMSVLEKSAWEFFWPVVVIIIGLRFIIGRESGHRGTSDVGPASGQVLFSGLERKVTGPVTNGNLSAWFGGAKVDLSGAQFPAETVLSLTAAFGGIELIVPKDVRVVNNVNGLFGGTEDKTNSDPNAAKKLTLTGTAMFGGVTIHN